MGTVDVIVIVVAIVALFMAMSTSLRGLKVAAPAEVEKTLSGLSKGDSVVFVMEFSDGYHEFSPGESAWVIRIVDSTTVEISGKPDEFATDSEQPFKFVVVPEKYLQLGTTASN